MNKVLKGLNFAFAYLDDIIIFSNTAEEHLQHIQMVIDRLKAAQLKLNKSKCSFFKRELYYLGSKQFMKRNHLSIQRVSENFWVWWDITESS